MKVDNFNMITAFNLQQLYNTLGIQKQGYVTIDSTNTALPQYVQDLPSLLAWKGIGTLQEDNDYTATINGFEWKTTDNNPDITKWFLQLGLMKTRLYSANTKSELEMYKNYKL